MRNRCTSFLLVFVIYTSLLLLAFGKLPLTFFQQDEWAILSYFQYWIKANLSWIDRLFVYEQYTHIIPLSNIISFGEFQLFGVYFPPYAIVSLLVHFTNSLLVYYLAHQIFKKNILALLAGLFFLTASIPHQAITWVATSMGTAGSTFFILLSIIYFIKFIENSDARRFFVYSMVLLFISLGFKESSLFMILFFPFCWLLFGKYDDKHTKKIFVTVFLLVVTYILFRFIVSSFRQIPPHVATEITAPVIYNYPYRVFATPIKFIAQSIVPVPIVIQLSRILLIVGYPKFVQNGVPDPYIVESVGSDIISFFIALIIILISGVCITYFKKHNRVDLAQVILLSLLYIALSSLPLIALGGKAGYFSLVDGRHLYVTSVFVSMLLTTWTYWGFLIFRNQPRALLLLLLVVSIYIVVNVYNIRSDINQQVGIGFIRKSILTKIRSAYPIVPKRVIYYVESDRPYYGLPLGENILPFQSGFGQTLLAWYSGHGASFPSCFFKGEYLYELLSEGYKECGGRGYGYFRKRETLKKMLSETAFKKENIIAFSYSSSNNTLVDITQELQNSF